MSETEQKIHILKNEIKQLEEDIKKAEEKIKDAIGEDKSLLIHIISISEIELKRLREELDGFIRL